MRSLVKEHSFFSTLRFAWVKKELTTISRKHRSGEGRGVSVFLAVIILSILLAIALGLSAILVSQIRMIKGMGDSINSFCAADTGVERVMYEDKICRLPDCVANCVPLGCSCVDTVNCDDGRLAGTVSGTVSGVLGNANYQVNVNDGATSISSQGIYRGTRRAVRVER